MKPSLKYRVIEQCKNRYAINQMCTFFGVSRSGYYNYQKRKDMPQKDAGLASLIAECQQERGKIHGYRYVHLWLERKKHYHCNPKTVLRVMNKYGLLSEVRRKKKYKIMGQQIHKY